jgi:hypothetical protein
MGWKEAIYTYPSSIVYEIHGGTLIQQLREIGRRAEVRETVQYRRTIEIERFSRVDNFTMCLRYGMINALLFLKRQSHEIFIFWFFLSQLSLGPWLTP